MSVSIEGVLRAHQAELAGLEERLRRRQHVVIRKVLEQQDRDLRVQEKGKWGAATRQRLLLFLGHGTQTMAAAQAVELGAGLHEVVGTSQRHAARWLSTLDRHYLGEVRPFAWTSKAWAQATTQEHLESRLRAFHGSFQRYGALVVGEVEQALGRIAKGASWDEVRALVAKATAEQTQGKAWMVERIVRTEAAHAYSSTAWRAFVEEDAPGDPMLKKLVAVKDRVTGQDSLMLDGQIRPVKEMFFDGYHGFHYMHPPNRPNDREIVVGWRASYGDSRKMRGRRAKRRMREVDPEPLVQDRERKIAAAFEAVAAAQRQLLASVGSLPRDGEAQRSRARRRQFDLDAKLAEIFASEREPTPALEPTARARRASVPRQPKAAPAAPRRRRTAAEVEAERVRKAAEKAAKAAERAAEKQRKAAASAAEKARKAEEKRAAAAAKKEAAEAKRAEAARRKAEAAKEKRAAERKPRAVKAPAKAPTSKPAEQLTVGERMHLAGVPATVLEARTSGTSVALRLRLEDGSEVRPVVARGHTIALKDDRGVAERFDAFRTDLSGLTMSQQEVDRMAGALVEHGMRHAEPLTASPFESPKAKALDDTTWRLRANDRSAAIKADVTWMTQNLAFAPRVHGVVDTSASKSKTNADAGVSAGFVPEMDQDAPQNQIRAYGLPKGADPSPANWARSSRPATGVVLRFKTDEANTRRSVASVKQQVAEAEKTGKATWHARGRGRSMAEAVREGRSDAEIGLACVRSTTRHEYGHGIEYGLRIRARHEDDPVAKAMLAKYAQLTASSTRDEAASLSVYGASDAGGAGYASDKSGERWAEFWAESSSAVLCGDEHLVPEKFRGFFRLVTMQRA